MTDQNLRPSVRRSFRVASASRLSILALGIAALAPRVTGADPLLAAPFLSFDTGSGPFAIAVGDVDGNGDADLVVANNYETTVSVLLARGDGTLDPRHDYQTAGAPHAVALADLDGNGSLDLVVANVTSHSLSVFSGLSDGHFGVRRDIPTGRGPTSVAIGDLNHDGRPDLVVTNYEEGAGNTVSVHLGSGGGDFRPRSTHLAGTGAFAVAIGDLNRDGNADLVVANLVAGSVSILLGDGGGAFPFARRVYPINSPGSVAVADLNGDGASDVVVASLSSVSVFLASGDGGLQPRTNYSVDGSLSGVAIGDLNRDGKPDLAVANNHTSAVHVLAGNGDGTFGVEHGWGAGTGAIAVAIGDFNGDGNPDLAAPNHKIGGSLYEGPNTVSVLLGNGDGTFGVNREFAAAAAGALFGMAVEDVNGDRELDVAVVDASSNTVSVLLGDGSGALQASHDFATGSSPFTVAIGDLNGDERQDLAVANSGSGTVSVLPGNGDGSFGPRIDFDAGERAYAVVIGELNGDGRADLVVTNYNNAGTVSVLLGKVHGMFGTKTDYATGAGPNAVAIGDLNQDGSPDLAVANNSASTVSVLLGRGNGKFHERTDYPTGGASHSVAIDDLNADGNLDLAVANIAVANIPDGTVSVLLGRGDGTFAPRTDFPTGIGPATVAIGDLNMDGMPDLAVANYGNNSVSTVSILFGRGDGTFVAKTDFGAGAGPWSLAIGDFNGDVRPDMAVANHGSRTVSLLLNMSETSASVAVRLELKPSKLNLNSKAEWVTGYLEPQPPFTAAQVDLASVRLNDAVPIAAGRTPSITDTDRDGVAEWKLSFSRASLGATLVPGDGLPVIVTGLIDGVPFRGMDHIDVHAPRMSSPAAGAVLAPGTTTEVRWEALDGGGDPVTLLSTFDEGLTWNREADGLPNNGLYLWTAPRVATDRARLAIVTLFAQDQGGMVCDREYAESETFSILATTGVANVPVELALGGVSPNPAIIAFSVNISLPNDKPATLSVFDISGRQVLMREVGSLGPGRHVVRVGDQRGLPAGVYIVKLTQSGHSFRTRAVVIR